MKGERNVSVCFCPSIVWEVGVYLYCFYYLERSQSVLPNAKFIIG